MAQQHLDPTDPVAGLVPGDALAGYLRAQATEFLRALRLHRETGGTAAGANGAEDSVDAARALRRSVRRVSGSLHTFRPLLDPEWSESLRPELAWLSGTLGMEHAYASRLDRLLLALHRLSGTTFPTQSPRTTPSGSATGSGAGTAASSACEAGGQGSVSAAVSTPSADGPADTSPAHGADGTASARNAGSTSSASGAEGVSSVSGAAGTAATRGTRRTATARGAGGPASADAAVSAPSAGGAGGASSTGGAGDAPPARGTGATPPARGAVGAASSRGAGGHHSGRSQRPGSAETGAGGPANQPATAAERGNLTVGAAKAGALLDRQLTLARTRAHSTALQALGSSRFHAVADTIAVLASEVPLTPAAADTDLRPFAAAAEERLTDAVGALPLVTAGSPYNAEALIHGLSPAPSPHPQDVPWHQVRLLLRLHRYAREVLDGEHEPPVDVRLLTAGQALDRHRDASEAAAAAAHAARTPRIAPATAYALGVLHADQRHEVEAARFTFQQSWQKQAVGTA